MTIPGIGYITAVTILAEIVDHGRFDSHLLEPSILMPAASQVTWIMELLYPARQSSSPRRKRVPGIHRFRSETGPNI